VDRERGELEQYIIAELKSQGVTTEGVNISPWDWRCVCDSVVLLYLSDSPAVHMFKLASADH
jgi:hypothetical protein